VIPKAATPGANGLGPRSDGAIGKIAGMFGPAHMRPSLFGVLVAAVLGGFSADAGAQVAEEMFRKVNRSVVVNTECTG
jgi:hypothetical protein